MMVVVMKAKKDLINLEKKLTVAKSNRLVEAAYRMTLVEQRIILLAASLARKTGKGLSPFDFVTISVSDYLEFFGDADNAYRQLKEAAYTLFSREFTLYDKDPETGKPRVKVLPIVKTKISRN
jgi:plasmid replication initiation protein